jgi:ribosomal protein S16
MRRPLLDALEKIDGMPVEKLGNYAKWKDARDAVYRALKATVDLERAERSLTAGANKVRHG